LAGRSYSIEIRDSLGQGAWQTWTNVETRTSSGVVEVTDSIDAEWPARFYRLTTPAFP
jgi:hypothetical protein